MTKSGYRVIKHNCDCALHHVQSNSTPKARRRNSFMFKPNHLKNVSSCFLTVSLTPIHKPMILNRGWPYFLYAWIGSWSSAWTPPWLSLWTAFSTSFIVSNRIVGSIMKDFSESRPAPRCPQIWPYIPLLHRTRNLLHRSIVWSSTCCSTLTWEFAKNTRTKNMNGVSVFPRQSSEINWSTSERQLDSWP